MAIGVFDPLQVPVRGTSSFDRVMDRWAAMETGAGFFWIASQGNRRSQQLASGLRAYARAHLQATALGMDMHPLSQALQEFAEMRGPHEELHRVLGFVPETTTAQMLARVGYGKARAQPSPRRSWRVCCAPDQNIHGVDFMNPGHHLYEWAASA